MLGLGVVKNKSMLLYIFFLIKNSAKWIIEIRFKNYQNTMNIFEI